jgi:hypothetical protein
MTHVSDYSPPLPNEPSREVQLAANAIGWALQQYCHLELEGHAALWVANNLENQGLLKLPDGRQPGDS